MELAAEVVEGDAHARLEFMCDAGVVDQLVRTLQIRVRIAIPPRSEVGWKLSEVDLAPGRQIRCTPDDPARSRPGSASVQERFAVVVAIGL